jgi:hypothetical protein
VSLLTEVGARVRAASDALPVGLAGVVAERLRSATELLDRVRQASVDPIGVPQLGAAVEHAERAMHLLLAAQDALAGYLASIGLAATGTPAPPESAPRVPRPAAELSAPPRRPVAGPLASWWRARVSELTGVPDGTPAPDPAADAAQLLERIAGAGRDRLAAELRAVDAGVGLGLAGVCAPLLERLVHELLGPDPNPADVPRLRAVAARARALLPGGDPATADTLLAHACRVPSAPPQGSHPADAAVTAAVLTGVLRARRATLG